MTPVRKKLVLTVTLLGTAAALLFGGSPFLDAKAKQTALNRPVQEETRLRQPADRDSLRRLADTWANALKTRDGKPRYDLMTEKAKKQFEQEQIDRSGEDWNYNIGVSSPWVVDYTIELDGLTATITYLTQTSEPAYYRSKETVTFVRDRGQLRVDAYQASEEE